VEEVIFLSLMKKKGVKETLRADNRRKEVRFCFGFSAW